MIPAGVSVIVLADRGFGRTELAAHLPGAGLRYVIRIKPDVTVGPARIRGVLRDYPTHKGMCRVLRDVDYRKDEPVRHTS